MFDLAVVKFDEQWKLKTLAESHQSLFSPVVGFAWLIQSNLAEGTIDYCDALALWALRN